MNILVVIVRLHLFDPCLVSVLHNLIVEKDVSWACQLLLVA